MIENPPAVSETTKEAQDHAGPLFSWVNNGLDHQ